MTSAPSSPTLDLVRSPKLNPANKPWYRYYAGFAPEFVDDVCEAFGVSTGTATLDPWMGSGTTLSVAAGRGSTVAGVDLNPAMLAVARGRLIAHDTAASLPSLGVDLVRHWRSGKIYDDEPLRGWFVKESAAEIRGLANRIHTVLIGPRTGRQVQIERASSLACFFYVALFDVVSTAVRAYGSRNPTWIKKSANLDGSVALTRIELQERFLAAVRRLSAHIRVSEGIDVETHDLANLHLGDSRALPFDDSTFDTVISSPPYLTRLDYVMGHAPELATLGFGESDIRKLRTGMIGTPIRASEDAPDGLGPFAEHLLDTVRNHDSYAASSYYEPNFRQYFVSMSNSLREIERVAKPGADVVLVVQDSRFKDLHLDLASALNSMASSRGWSTGQQKDFVNVRSMAQLNKRAHHLARNTKPTESIITLKTPVGMEPN